MILHLHSLGGSTGSIEIRPRRKRHCRPCPILQSPRESRSIQSNHHRYRRGTLQVHYPIHRHFCQLWRCDLNRIQSVQWVYCQMAEMLMSAFSLQRTVKSSTMKQANFLLLTVILDSTTQAFFKSRKGANDLQVDRLFLHKSLFKIASSQSISQIINSLSIWR